MEKICKKHGLTEYAIRKDGRARCKKCNVEAVQKRRDDLKIMAVTYKGKKCQICGYNKYVGALEFHHIKPEDKNFTISRKGYTRSWENVKRELDKCVLLCSICHKEAEAGLLDISMLNSNYNIPIEIKIKTNYCVDCGIEIDKDAKRCVKCHNISRRKIKNRPNKEKLLDELKFSSYLAVGKKYGVSDNAIRKWLKSY
jgi:hypothetical protein